MSKEATDPYLSPASDVEFVATGLDIVTLRKQLVPLWIKIFGWIFILMGVTAPLAFIYTLSSGVESSFSIFGLEASGDTLSFTSLLINILLVALAVSAYGLLFGKNWGLNACLVTGYLGLFVTIGVTVFSIASGEMVLQLEPLIQIPYLIKLHRIRPQWSPDGKGLSDGGQTAGP